MTWTIQVRLTVCGHAFKEVDITGALAIGVWLFCTFLLVVEPWR